MEHIQRTYNIFAQVFWSEKFWLSHNVTWNDFKNEYDSNGGFAAGSIRHPQPRELFMVVPVTIFMLILRHLLESFVMKPIARSIGVRGLKTVTPEKIPKLDQFFRTCRRPSHMDIKSLAQQMDMSERRIERWFRIKRNQRKSSLMKKFCEGGFRFTFHLSLFSYGLYVLYDEDFANNTNLIIEMETWPHHHIKQEFFNYYMITLGYWTSVIITLVSDVRRHDFYIMVVHHLLTCSLIALSWSANFVRVGMLVLIAHDFADFFLEICKMMKYAKKEALSNLSFVLFFLSWSVSRLYFYPKYIVVVCWSKYIEYYQETGGLHALVPLVMISFLLLLLVLHIIWTCIIVRLVYELLFKKEWVDHRSDSEPENSSESSEANGVHEKNGAALRNGLVNGKDKKHD